MTQIAPTPEDLADLIDLYVVANTPEYLYRSMRASIPVQIMARTESQAGLARTFKKSSGKKNRSIRDVVLAYSALIAITLGDRAGATKALDGLDLSRLDWAESIVADFVRKPLSVRANIEGNTAPRPTITLRSHKARRHK